MGHSRIRRIVYNFIREHSGIANYDPKTETLNGLRYREDNIQDLFMGLEETFGIDLDDKTYTTNQTPTEIARQITAKLDEKGIHTTRQLRGSRDPLSHAFL